MLLYDPYTRRPTQGDDNVPEVSGVPVDLGNALPSTATDLTERASRSLGSDGPATPNGESDVKKRRYYFYDYCLTMESAINQQYLYFLSVHC